MDERGGRRRDSAGGLSDWSAVWVGLWMREGGSMWGAGVTESAPTDAINRCVIKLDEQH